MKRNNKSLLETSCKSRLHVLSLKQERKDQSPLLQPENSGTLNLYKSIRALKDTRNHFPSTVGYPDHLASNREPLIVNSAKTYKALEFKLAQSNSTPALIKRHELTAFNPILMFNIPDIPHQSKMAHSLPNLLSNGMNKEVMAIAGLLDSQWTLFMQTWENKNINSMRTTLVQAVSSQLCLEQLVVKAIAKNSQEELPAQWTKEINDLESHPELIPGNPIRQNTHLPSLLSTNHSRAQVFTTSQLDHYHPVGALSTIQYRQRPYQQQTNPLHSNLELNHMSNQARQIPGEPVVPSTFLTPPLLPAHPSRSQHATPRVATQMNN
ncbi:hypothetical protein PCANC_04172 [Puccinia coronata f. sp. avenae]|uniref:Uncharacterized protein n=1 Tax=Puccinia coronata f. sp. avenae TaxID=200324 RepID=A0A2N5W7C8_9BASI|nr:hypothetical protein PCANC_04172 [Puccinia coronata f. sp. avenae]